jgi:hypothetical protein
MATPVYGLPGGTVMSEETLRPVIHTETAIFDAVPDWAVPYAAAAVPSLPHWVDPADPGSQFSMTDGIRAVVDAEAPVHISVVHQRLRDAWNIGRIGTLIRDNIDAAITLAGVIREGEFLMLADAPPPAVRTPTQGCERTVDQVHDHELALALVGLVCDARSLSQSELTTRVARLYGWAESGPEITNRMGALVAELTRNGTLADDEQSLKLGPVR